MPNVKEKLKTFLNVFRSHPACLTNTIFLALAAGFEQVWEEVVFKCPNNTSTVQHYSIISVLAPALALYILGILVSNTAWRLCQGMKYSDTPHDCSCCRPCCCHVGLRAFVVPATWGFVALMDGDFYTCFYYMPGCPQGSTSDFINDVNCTNNVTVWNRDRKVVSQTIGWIYLAVCLCFILMVVFCSRYYSRSTYFPNLYSNNLKKKERMLLEKLLQVRAEKEATRNVGALMMKFSTVPAKGWESICKEYTVKEGKEAEQLTSDVPTDANKKKPLKHYSPLSEYLSDHPTYLNDYDKVVEEQQKTQTVAQTQGPQNPEPKP